jgi:hypothetical protein
LFFTKPSYLSITGNETVQNSKSKPKNSHSCVPLRSTCPGDVIFRDKDLDYPPSTPILFFPEKAKTEEITLIFTATPKSTKKSQGI